MKIHLRVVLVICSLILMVSCSNYPPVGLDGTDIDSLDFGKVLEDSIIYKLFVQVGSQGITLMEGELFSDGQVYGFNLLDRQLVLEKAEGTWAGDSVGISPDELMQILSDLQIFIGNEYDMQSFEARWFLLPHVIHGLDSTMPVYRYDSSGIWKSSWISEISTSCILVSTGDAAFMVLIK